MDHPAPSINHHRQGIGEPLVLLHGVGQLWQVWQPVIDLVDRDFETIACDSPGFGASPPLPGGARPTIPACADALQAFFAAEGLGRPHVAGNSMGGAIALELARRGAVRSATAFSPAGFWSPAELRWAQLVLGLLGGAPQPLKPVVVAAMRARAPRAVIGRLLFAKPGLVPADAIERELRAIWEAPAYGAAVAAFSSYRFSEGDELRGTPVTVAWGRHDRLLPFRTQSKRAEEQLPWARHVVLGTGHLPYRDDTAAVAATLRSGAGPT
ncbi:MAG: alpha/beta fold hydrolase [Solirubrobacteraceae bacterium]|nr:alpha/beta fold hydrolase [Solirubrobacteraceae bacterium]